MALSRARLKELTDSSPDPHSWGTTAQTPTKSFNENSQLSDDALDRIIAERNRAGKPTYKLRLEYERRLIAKGL